ncbi:MAG: 16S rRNA (adenine(1518)-N(6)/adenine(1519)-N(6))-dimethyltransferase RsmA [Roseivirga sp.]
MTRLIAKKSLGQHFLQDQNIARKIVGALSKSPQTLVEIGPGAGVLTNWLVQQRPELYLVEIDTELVAHLKQAYPLLRDRVLAADFLQLSLDQYWQGPITLIGNFPYNISSQIFFKVLAHRQQVQEVVGMVQKEVAERLVAPPGSKTYGILSVLLQAFYRLEYLFTVGPQVFNPPPKVQSAVIRLQRNNTEQLGCDEQLFFKVVKAGFQQRRKTLRNALKALLPTSTQPLPLLNQRAEQLTVADFVSLTQYLSST